LIAGLLEEIECGKRRRLAIAVPVRHGKSTISSRIFTAWFLGRHPDRNVILASHSEDLAVGHSRVAKHLVEDDRWPFAGVKLSADSSAAGRWDTKQGDGCYAIGTLGSITGRGSDVLLLDDALHDGLSETERVKVYQWYSEVAIPRLEPGGAVVVIGARFAEDDLLGRILESDDAPNWEGNVVSLPALCEDEDSDVERTLGRRNGDALWADRISVDEINMRRVAMGPRAYDAQMRQCPQGKGSVFHEEWMLQRYRFGDHPKGLRIIQSIDSAWKESTAADWSVIATWGASKTHFYLLDIWRAQVEFPALKRAVAAQYELWNPVELAIEKAASGWAIVQSLKDETNWPIIGVPSTESKFSRANAVTPLFEAGRIMLPDRAPWLQCWIDEHVAFGAGAGAGKTRKDDQVDTTSLALARMQTSKPRDIYIGSAWDGGGITRISASGGREVLGAEEFVQHPDVVPTPSLGLQGTFIDAMRRRLY
jgi:predicted phage terminase large subunit-like protein